MGKGLLTLLISTICLNYLASESTVLPNGPKPDYKILTMKDINHYLDERFLSCEDCVEKIDYVNYLDLHWNDPIKVNIIKEDDPDKDDSWDNDPTVEGSYSKMFESFRQMGFNIPAEEEKNLKAGIRKSKLKKEAEKAAAAAEGNGEESPATDELNQDAAETKEERDDDYEEEVEKQQEPAAAQHDDDDDIPHDEL